MLALNINCDVLSDRLVTIKLPDTVPIGRQELLIVLNQNNDKIDAETSSAKKIMNFSGVISAFKEINGVECQKSMREEWE